jgi:tetratricopeptide (TPR) repeat protein
LDRAIDIKRRAQRCIQSGDLPGALAEYEKLVAADASDPYTYVLLADLLYKMGEHPKAGERYLTAASCYEQAGLYKNAIAVGKKMLRLALTPAAVLERLAVLHALDGLATESSLYYMQYAEHLVRESRIKDASATLRKAFDTCPENFKALERLAEVYELAGDGGAAARTLAEAAVGYARSGHVADAERCAARAEAMRPGVVAEFESQGQPAAGRSDGYASGGGFGPEPGMLHASVPVPALDTVSFADLDTDRPPRFVPPVDALPAMELDGHGGRSDDEGVTAIPSLPVASPFADGAAAEGTTDIESVERLLGLAQTEFRAGNHASAAKILARAALAYESLDRWDDAVAIHRSLCKSPHATTEMIERWLDNCEHRKDRSEAARVACELGDRAISGNDLGTAETWFRRALELDVHNTVAARRLERLGHGVPAAFLPAPVAAPPAPVHEEPLPAPENGGDGKVEVAVDRGQAVTFDFASMLAEFQRGVQTQLSGDAQAHYDLAMAYREMGLIEQAVESFRLAAQDARFRQRCSEMIGHCLLEEGRFEEAAQELTLALAHTALEPENAIGIRYQLGLALEAAGHAHEALSEFERVFAVEANYPDVAAKIRDLRKNLEAA